MTPFPLCFCRSSWFWLAGCLGLTAAALAQSPREAPVAPPPPEVERLATAGLRPIDRTFLDRAAELSQQQIGLATLAVSHAWRADVRTFAQQLASDHRQISDSVQSLRRRRGAATEEAAGPAPPGEAYGRLARVTGAEFDREFILAIEAVRAETMTLFEEVISQTRDAGVRDLIGGYLPVLRDHQNQAIELRRELE